MTVEDPMLAQLKLEARFGVLSEDTARHILALEARARKAEAELAQVRPVYDAARAWFDSKEHHVKGYAMEYAERVLLETIGGAVAKEPR